MDISEFTEAQTKRCLFCAEVIQEKAIKCRFCNEFLNTDKASQLQEDTEDTQPQEDEALDEQILFSGRPNLLGIAGTFIKGAVFGCLAAFLFVYPLELHSFFDLTENQAIEFAEYRVMAGAALVVFIVLVILLKMLKLKMTYYEINADRIEWSRGLLDRRVDNLDMLRVVDLKLRRSLLDCILGIGTVSLITTDKTDPDFSFEKIRNSRKLYDIIKKASLEADKTSGVVHLE